MHNDVEASRINADQIVLLPRIDPNWTGRSFAFQPRSDVPVYIVSYPVNWRTDPFSDRNWCLQLDMLRMLDWSLEQHDRTKNSAYLSFPLQLIRDWHRYHTAGTSYYAWNDMAVGSRAMKLAYILSQAQNGYLQMDSETVAVLDALVASHLEFLLDTENVSYMNHTFTVLQGAAALAQVVDKQRRTQIYAFIDQVLPKLLDAQFTEHAIHRENSPEYHQYATNYLRTLRDCGWFPGYGLEGLIARADKQWDWLLMPDGRAIPFGDTNGQQQRSGVIPLPEGVFNKSGYCVIRNGPSFLSFMGAFNSKSHKHPDDLSFVWYEGEDILCDVGKYAYKNNLQRAYAVSTRAHNTVEIDGKNYKGKPFGSAVGCAAVFDWGFAVDGYVNHTDSGVKHARYIMYSPGAWLLVIDNLISASTHDYTAWFHFAPHLPSLVKVVEGYETTLASGKKLLVQSIGTGPIASALHKGTTKPVIQGWISQAYGKMTPNQALEYRQRGRNAIFATIFSLRKDATLFLKEPKHVVLQVDGQTFKIAISAYSYRVVKTR